MKRINRQIVTGSALFSALLCVCAVAGVELRACDGLGFSWAQRLTLFVPALLGCTALFSLLIAWLIRPRDPALPASPPSLFKLSALFFLCYTPALLAYCPGIIAYDATNQILQGIDHAYTTHHPLLHTLLLSVCVRVGAYFYSYTLGAGLYTLAQMALLSLLFACVCRELSALGAPRRAVVGVALFYALYPVNAIMAISSTKDTLFAALITLLLLRTVALLRGGRAFLLSPRRVFGYVLLAALVCLMRNNGVYALIFLTLCCVLAYKGLRVRLFALFAACVLAYGGINTALVKALDAQPGSTLEMLCIPIQQMARVARFHADELSEDDAQALSAYMPLGEDNRYDPHLADCVKMNMSKDAVSRDPAAFLSLWARLGRQYPGEYANAALALNQGMWDPFDTSTGHIYDAWGLAQHGYLQTRFQRRIDDERGIFIEQQSFLPPLKALYERLCTENIHQRCALTNLLFSPGSILWLCALAALCLLLRGCRAAACAASLLAGLFLTQLLGPCALTRYAYPFFTSLPVLWALMRIPGEKCITRKNQIQKK